MRGHVVVPFEKYLMGSFFQVPPVGVKLMCQSQLFFLKTTYKPTLRAAMSPSAAGYPHMK